jgi:hypothetical protein
MPTPSLPAASLSAHIRFPARRAQLWASNYLIYLMVWSIGGAMVQARSEFLPAVREGGAPAGGKFGDRGILTARGGGWCATTVKNLLDVRRADGFGRGKRLGAPKLGDDHRVPQPCDEKTGGAGVGPLPSRLRVFASEIRWCRRFPGLAPIRRPPAIRRSRWVPRYLFICVTSPPADPALAIAAIGPPALALHRLSG